MKLKIIIAAILLIVVAIICYAQPPPIGPLIMRFLDLTDVDEATYVGQAGKFVQVSAGETTLEFGTPAGAGDLLADGSVPMTANWDIGNYDITLKSLTGDGSLDFGGGVSTELVNAAAPTTDATGEIALDTTIVDHQPLWQYYDGGENMTIIAIDTAQLPALDNEIVKYDAATDKFVLEADASAGDPVLINNVAITDGLGVDFIDGTGITITLNAGASPDTATIAATLGTSISDAEVDNNITIDLATLATTVTTADDENSADNQEIVFTTTPVGAADLETDGDFHYNPSTGMVTATGFTGALTGNATTVTNGVYTTDNLSVLAATTSAQLYGVLSDETGSGAGAPLAVFNQAPIIDSPTFTTAITATDLIDSAHYNADSIDNEHINWADIDNLGDEGAIVVADTADATSFVALWESATGSLAAKSDAGLTYNATTANLATTTFTGALAGNATTATTASAGDAAVDFFGGGVTAVTDATTCTDIEGTGLSIGGGTLNWSAASTDLTDTADILYETELDDFAELDGQIADKSLINLEDGGTFTGNVIANANLSVGNAGTTAGVLTLLEDDDDGANFASFMVPALADNTVYTLPPDDGDNTEVLQTNGAGVLTWVANAGGGATAWDDISDPDNNGATTISFDNAETTIITGDNDAAVSFFTIQNTDADHTGGNMYLLDLDYSADDGDGDADFIKCQDSGGVVFSVGQDGELAMDGGATIGGSLEAATITEGLIGVPNLNETDWVNEDEMADSDHGDVEWAAGVAYVQAATIADTAYASCYVGLFQGAAGNNEPFYTDAALTYDATSGTLSSTVLTEGGNAVYNSTEVPGGSLGGTWANPTIDDLFILLGGDIATAGDYDFGSANVDLELPQASPAVPDVDGQVEIDFTDGTVVIQHGSAHAELGSSTDVVVGKLIRSFGGTIFEPDGVNDVITVKAINSIEFPHGIVVTAIYLGVSSDDGYVLTVQNFDDFDTINGANPTIDIVTYPADTTGEIIDSTPTFATIAAGQIIMISIPATDVDWIHFEIYYYEPAA